MNNLVKGGQGRSDDEVEALSYAVCIFFSLAFVAILVAAFAASVTGGVVPDIPIFFRGDADNSGAVNLADAVFIDEWLFNGGDEPPCVAQADVNGDESVNLSDEVYLLNYLFAGGPEPPHPFPDCGKTQSTLSCKQSQCSP